MLLAIDIGNTNISFGVFREKRIVRRFDILTKEYNPVRLKKNLAKIKIGEIIICSVVPSVTKVLEIDCKKIFSCKLHVLGRDITVPIKNLYRNPKQVGQDRLVNAYAGVMLYGAPLIVVDFGTAVTFDVISRKKEYLGGMILPGLQISLDALFERTALLPRVKLTRPKEFIGRDTKNSMLSGTVYGFACLVDDLNQRIKDIIGRDALVIGTGGNIGLIGKHCRRFDKIDQGLTLRGLNFIFQTFTTIFKKRLTKSIF